MLIHYCQDHLLFLCDDDVKSNESTGVYVVHAHGHVLKTFQVTERDMPYHLTIVLQALKYLWTCNFFKDD